MVVFSKRTRYKSQQHNVYIANVNIMELTVHVITYCLN